MDTYFSLLPIDLLILLAFHFSLETVNAYCKTIRSWKSICTNVQYLHKYVSKIYDVPVNIVMKVPDQFFIDYSSSTDDRSRFDLSMKYDFLAVFEHYFEHSYIGDYLKGYRLDNYVMQSISKLLATKSYNIIYYLLKNYGDHLSLGQRATVLQDIVKHRNLNLLKSVLEELKFDRPLSAYEKMNVLSYAGFDKNAVKQYLSARHAGI